MTGYHMKSFCLQAVNMWFRPLGTGRENTFEFNRRGIIIRLGVKSELFSLFF